MDERSRRNHFAALALDRGDAVRLQPEAVRRAWQHARVLAIDFEGRCPAAGAGPHVLSADDLSDPQFAAASLLGFSAPGTAWFALPAESLPDGALPADVAWTGLREAAALWSRFDSGLFAYAKALLLWQTRARFCGACGTATLRIRAGHCVRCTNPECGLQQFPRTDAAIIVLVTDGTRCLLGRQAGWPPKRWSTLAGFVEPGESLEDAVRREVQEESGVRVDACSYQSSQPWPFPGALMVGFRAVCADAAIALGDELEDARWFEAQDLLDAALRGDIGLPPAISISRRLIEDWLEDTLGPEAPRALAARRGRAAGAAGPA